MAANIIQEKICSACKQVKLATEFYNNRKTRDGLCVYCKPCWKSRDKMYVRKIHNVPAPLVNFKQCVTCHQVKAVLDFYFDKGKKDGVDSRCISCFKAYKQHLYKQLKEAPEQKYCAKCDQTKPASEFHKGTGCHLLSTYCKPCYRIYQKEYRDSHRAEIREHALKYGKTPFGRVVRQNAKLRYNKTPHRITYERAYNLRRKYGMEPADYDRRVQEQNGKCAICGTKPPEHSFLHVDHDHANGLIRGLLCSPCNKALGGFQDRIERLDAAKQYLLFYRAVHS